MLHSKYVQGSSTFPGLLLYLLKWGSADMALENLKDVFVFLARTVKPPGCHSSASDNLSALDQNVLWHCLGIALSFSLILLKCQTRTICRLSAAQISLSVQDLLTVTYWQTECKQPVLFTSNTVLPYLYFAE